MNRNNLRGIVESIKVGFEKTGFAKGFLLYTSILVLTTFFYSLSCYSQEKRDAIGALKNTESIEELSDTIMKKEIALFYHSNSALNSGNFYKGLIEIPLIMCNEKEVYFSKANIWNGDYITIYLKDFDTTGHELTFVNEPEKYLSLIDKSPFWGTDGKIPRKKVDSILFNIHDKLIVKFPRSAFTGIYEPNECICDRKRVKKGKFTTPYYKIFRTKDYKHIYIYMLNGQGKYTYEVTWIIKSGKYYTRVIDAIPDK